MIYYADRGGSLGYLPHLHFGFFSSIGLAVDSSIHVTTSASSQKPSPFSTFVDQSPAPSSCAIGIRIVLEKRMPALILSSQFAVSPNSHVKWQVRKLVLHRPPTQNVRNGVDDKRNPIRVPKRIIAA